MGDYKRLAQLLREAQDISASIAIELKSQPEFRAEYINATRNLTRTLQGPVESAQEIFFAPYCLTSLETALDAGWLQAIHEADDKGATVESLAAPKGAEVSLVRQICRFLAANGILKEVGQDVFATTQLTGVLCDTASMRAGVKHASHVYMQAAYGMPDYFASNGYSRPRSIEDTPYKYAEGDTLWGTFAKNPAHGGAFNAYMAAMSLGKKAWFDAFPVKEKFQTSADDVSFIDMGGGKGHELAELVHKEGARGFEGKLVLQDLPDVIEQVPKERQGLFEACKHSFFDPQPKQYVHAKAYYMRHVLHDWSDEKCLEILGHIRDAMKPEYSMLLINEVVIPVEGCTAAAAGLDIVMMSVAAGRERTEGEWKDLIEQVDGLKIQQYYKLSAVGHALIEVHRAA